MRKHLFVCVESPDGRTWTQEIEWRDGEPIRTAINRYKKTLGRKYMICDWWTD